VDLFHTSILHHWLSFHMLLQIFPCFPGTSLAHLWHCGTTSNRDHRTSAFGFHHRGSPRSSSPTVPSLEPATPTPVPRRTASRRWNWPWLGCRCERPGPSGCRRPPCYTATEPWGIPRRGKKCGKNGEKYGRNVVEMGRSPFQRQISKRPKLITHIARNEVFIRRAFATQ
jgi:hypothetical protein